MTHRPSWVLLLSAAVMATGTALAEPSPPVSGNKERAREWAEKANERFEAKDYTGAVDAMIEAEKHYRAPTFLMLRAEALEKLGRLLEARQVFQVVAEWDLPPKAAAVWLAAKKDASRRMTALDALIPTLVVTVSGTSSKVTIDGTSLPAEMLGKPRSLDPGKHTVIAGEGAAAVKYEVVLNTSEMKRVTIEPIPIPPPRVDGVTPALASFGVGAAGLVVGSIFGGLVASTKNEVLTGVDACGAECAPAEQARLEGVLADSKTFAHVSTAGFVIAGVGAAAGVTLFILSRPRTPAGPRLRITTGSISLSGSF